jgi:hypothetical protein
MCLVDVYVMPYVSGGRIPMFQRNLPPPSPGQMPKNLVLYMNWGNEVLSNNNEEFKLFYTRIG